MIRYDERGRQEEGSRSLSRCRCRAPGAQDGMLDMSELYVQNTHLHVAAGVCEWVVLR